MSNYMRPYLLCEVANVHAGDKNYLNNLIDEFSKVDYNDKGIKFQIFKSDRIALPDFEWFPVYERLFFSPHEWQGFINKATSFGDVWIDIFDTYGVEVLAENIGKIAGIKLQASILQNQEVFDSLQQIDLSSKKIMINISGFDIDRIYLFIKKFQSLTKNIILQIGYQSYPTQVSDTGLQKIPTLRATFPNLDICIADHADATTDFALRAPIYGVLLGCNYIEKHFCLSRENTEFDKYSALEPNELNYLCHEIEELLEASSGRFIEDAESRYLSNTVQIPVLKYDLTPGSLVSQKDIIYRRTSQVGLDLKGIEEIQFNKHIIQRPITQNSTLNNNDFKKARVGVIAACRMKSTRLPKKAILPIDGKASVEHCLEQCLEISNVDEVILATSNLDSDNELVNYNLDGKAKLYRGDPDDVIARYINACDKYDIDVVVRVTADCPLIVPEILDFLLEKHFESGADYTAAKDFAVGSSGEIINTEALRRVAQYFENAEYSEYMTWYFQNNPDIFKINLVDLPTDYIRNYRMTLDYPEDLDFFKAFYKQYNALFGSAPKRMDNIFEVLDNHSEIADINSHLTLKYKTDKELINTLNMKTRIHRKK